MQSTVTQAENAVRRAEHSIDVVYLREIVRELAGLVPGYKDITQDITVVVYKTEKRFELISNDTVISFGELDALELAIVQAQPCTVVERIER